MADYISRDYTVENMENYPWDTEHDKNAAIHLVRELVPAADARPVVLCRDCRWWTKQEKSLQGRCELGGFYPTGEWFCANGERSNCGADMREPNLDTTKGDNHD